MVLQIVSERVPELFLHNLAEHRRQNLAQEHHDLEDLHQHVGADHHGRAGGLRVQGVGLPDHARVEEADELELELHSLLRAALRGGFESGGDAVDVTPVHDLVEHPVGWSFRPPWASCLRRRVPPALRVCEQRRPPEALSGWLRRSPSPTPT